MFKEHELYGTVTARMAAYQVLTALYKVDYFVNGPKMLPTWDIITEYFGLMFVYGDFVFIIFAFSQQNFYLLHNFSPFSPPWPPRVPCCSSRLRCVPRHQLAESSL